MAVARIPDAGHMGITDEVIKRSLEFIREQSNAKAPDRK